MASEDPGGGGGGGAADYYLFFLDGGGGVGRSSLLSEIINIPSLSILWHNFILRNYKRKWIYEHGLRGSGGRGGGVDYYYFKFLKGGGVGRSSLLSEIINIPSLSIL